MPSYTAASEGRSQGPARRCAARVLPYAGHGQPRGDRGGREGSRAVRSSRRHVTDITIPDTQYASLAWLIITQSEMFGYHHDNLRTAPEKLGDLFRQRLYFASLLTSADYIRAQQFRGRFRRNVAAAFESVDIMLTPTGGPAQKDGPGERHGILLGSGSTNPFSLAGVPAISVPCGFSQAGLPLGLQIAGRSFDEATVFRAAYAYEQSSGFGNKRPPHRSGLDHLSENSRTTEAPDTPGLILFRSVTMDTKCSGLACSLFLVPCSCSRQSSLAAPGGPWIIVKQTVCQGCSSIAEPVRSGSTGTMAMISSSGLIGRLHQ